MKPTQKIKKLSLDKSTLKNLHVKTSLVAGDAQPTPCQTAAKCTIECYVSCEAGAFTLCKGNVK